MKTFSIGILCVIGVGIIASIVTASMNGLLFQTSFHDWSDDSEYYNARALSLVHTGSLGEEQALFRRPPGYSFFLASVYEVFGEHIAVAWIWQEILFVASLLLLWRISIRFTAGWYALLPPLFTGLYWGANFYVFEIGAEMLALFFLLLFVFLLILYREEHLMRFLIFCGVVGGALALTKPVFFYASLLLFGGVVYKLRSNGYKVWLHAAAACLFVFLFVGGWAMRTYALFGETQIERIGHIVYTRSLYGSLSWREISVHLIASLTGDYVADQVSPGYGANPISQRLGTKRVEAMAKLREQGLSLAEAEANLLHEGIVRIQQHPIKFFAGVVPLIFDLNTLENYRGFPITRMFVGTRDSIAPALKVGILLTLHIVWFLVLGFSVFGFLLLIRDSFHAAWPILFLILFFNSVHALIILPAEPRFIMPVLPFYFLGSTMNIQWVLTRVKKIHNVEGV